MIKNINKIIQKFNMQEYKILYSCKNKITEREKMKKSNKKIILIILLLLLIIISIFLFKGGSFSKYLTQVNGKGVIDVAKWAFLVNGQTASITNLNLAQTYKQETLKENTIAPGTAGTFDVQVDATGSEVGINYKVVFQNEKSKPHNLTFTYNGNTVNSIKELEQFLTGTINANSNEKVKTMTIEWNWPYETGKTPDDEKQQDKEDTEDGKLLEEYSFDIIITGTQVEPN